MARRRSGTAEEPIKAPKTLHDPASEDETEDLAPWPIQDTVVMDVQPPQPDGSKLDQHAPAPFVTTRGPQPLSEAFMDTYADAVTETVRDPLVADSAVLKVRNSAPNLFN